MQADDTAADREDVAGDTLRSRKGCEAKQFHGTADDGSPILVNCKSRFENRCRYCAGLYRAEKLELSKSGIDGTGSDHRFIWATVTAPSFGAVHTPFDGAACACGRDHADDDSANHVGLPIDRSEYDYTTQALFNHYIDVLRKQWFRRIRTFARGTEMIHVHEMQMRGALHLHVLVRTPAASDLTADKVAAFAQASEKLTIVGEVVRFGGTDVTELGSPDESADDIEQQAMNRAAYMAKSLGVLTPEWPSVDHEGRLIEAAAHTPCSETGCGEFDCNAWPHYRYGTRKFMWVQTEKWSLTGLTCTVLRERRKEYARADAERREAARAIDADVSDPPVRRLRRRSLALAQREPAVHAHLRSHTGVTVGSECARPRRPLRRASSRWTSGHPP